VIRAALTTALVLSFLVSAAAHHGGGTFDGSKEIKLTGTFTGLDLINPHSWIYFDVKVPTARSRSIAARCEPRPSCGDRVGARRCSGKASS
jgi:hypothetical protein